MNRDKKILESAIKIHKLLWDIYEELGGDVDAGIATLEFAKTMFVHFGSPDGDNKGRTSATLSKVKAWQQP